MLFDQLSIDRRVRKHFSGSRAVASSVARDPKTARSTTIAVRDRSRAASIARATDAPIDRRSIARSVIATRRSDRNERPCADRPRAIDRRHGRRRWHRPHRDARAHAGVASEPTGARGVSRERPRAVPLEVSEIGTADLTERTRVRYLLTACQRGPRGAPYLRNGLSH